MVEQNSRKIKDLKLFLVSAPPCPPVFPVYMSLYPLVSLASSVSHLLSSPLLLFTLFAIPSCPFPLPLSSFPLADPLSSPTPTEESPPVQHRALITPLQPCGEECASRERFISRLDSAPAVVTPSERLYRLLSCSCKAWCWAETDPS